MITVGLYYEVIPGKEPIFEQTVEQVMQILRTHPGHLNSLLYRQVHQHSSYAIISEWLSQTDFVAFVRSDTFKQVTNFGKAEVLLRRPQHKVYGHERDLNGRNGNGHAS